MTDTATDPTQKIEEGLAALGTRFREAFGAAATEQALRAEHAKLLGKKGDLTAVLALLRDVPGPQKGAAGARVNAFKAEVEQAFEARLDAIAKDALEADLRARPFDVSLPGRLPFQRRGHVHPVLAVRDELIQIFRELGFQAVSGPEIESEANNFTKLAFPPDHPATDMQD
ncbi:MAG TPA: hypothetical protein VL400_27845, partial [Polyangiaceae bacterium]|nr:hypothetical protein [Polyangiaceae bacterium]